MSGTRGPAPVHRGGPLRGLPAAVAIVLAAGCGLIGFDTGSGTANQCTSDSGCGRDAMCDRALGMCVAQVRPAAGVFLRFSYPASSGVAIREFQSQRLDEAGSVTYAWPAPIEVRGAVREAGTERVVPATITFSRASAISGEPPETATTDANGNLTYDAVHGDFSYSVRLIPWRAEREPYAVYVKPTGADAAAVPPLLTTGLELAEAGDGAPTHFDIELPAADSLRRIEGVVTRSDGEAVPNLSVRAEDPASGQRISTIATTAPLAASDGDPPTGTFSLLLPSSVATFRLVVAPTPDQPNYPTLVWDGLVFDTLDANHDSILVFDDAATDPAADRPAIAFPAIGLPVVLDGTVEGLETGTSTAVPVAGATLRFVRAVHTATVGMTATFERKATTDGLGRIVPDATSGTTGVALLEGDYDVTVTPPPDVRMAGLHVDFLRVADATGTGVQRGQVFQLGARADLRGSVLDLGHRPVGALSLEAELLEPGGDDTGADPAHLNGIVDGYTDLAGAFDLFVEPGTHLLLLQPPDGSGFPWRVVSNVHAPNGPVDVSLEAPVPLEGVVTIGGAPTEGVTVEALVGEDVSGAAVAVGKSATDEAGTFRLLLSPSLGTL